ncbi:alpha/beta hydrolase fold protein [Kribbella flavida DSM 17836]|uniref:Alpha/beta hydrolase fold protein n=1 Tax=Kribbella flavida (strain DSM 17836 / JCM 10339 / NBRC 14399) TaxID=479435 RepID=D2PUK6_KRIFD|nr:alpha/beta hydrolase [Kribbella flavida]ADB29524.1 alpha/beta hydrolase fold protein [Kribbella flavida DSM 17836]
MLTEIRGTRLYVDPRGAADAPPLLYIHGGPGAGSYDFLAYQGDRLAERLRVIGVDQRGVQQSDPIDEPATEEDVIADFEALRDQLRVDHWAVLGHSYGGRLALRYAVTRPETVSKVIFENPPWDMVLATRTLVEAAGPLLSELGLENEAKRLLAHQGPATSETWDERIALLHQLGDRRMEVYLGPTSHGLRLPSNDLPEEVQERAGYFAETITRAPSFNESLLPYLAQLTQPALLIKGEYDPVTSSEEIARFQADAPNATYRQVDGVGHFVHAEQPAEYAELVTAFVLGSAAALQQPVRD